MKETTPIYVGYKSKEIEEIKKYNDKVKNEIKERKAKRRTTLQKIEDEYFSEVQEDNIMLINGELRYITKPYVIEKVIKYHTDNNVLIRQFMIVSLCQTLCLKYVNSYSREFQQKIFDLI